MAAWSTPRDSELGGSGNKDDYVDVSLACFLTTCFIYFCISGSPFTPNCSLGVPWERPVTA